MSTTFKIIHVPVSATGGLSALTARVRLSALVVLLALPIGAVGWPSQALALQELVSSSKGAVAVRGRSIPYEITVTSLAQKIEDVQRMNLGKSLQDYLKSRNTTADVFIYEIIIRNNSAIRLSITPLDATFYLTPILSSAGTPSFNIKQMSVLHYKFISTQKPVVRRTQFSVFGYAGKLGIHAAIFTGAVYTPSWPEPLLPVEANNPDD